MNGLHYDEEALIDFLVTPDEAPDREEIEEHLTECASCREIAESFQQFSQSLSDDVVWEREELSSALSKADESGLEQLLAYSRKLDSESAEAQRQVATLMSLDPGARRELIEMSAEMWTVGVARELSERARQAGYTSPADAVHLGELAVQVCDKLPTDTYRFGTIVHLRGFARKDYGLALKDLGRYPEALAVLEEAEKIYDGAPMAEYDLAVIAYVRAMVLRDLDRLTEALALVQHSARVFAEFGHQERYRHARMVEAAVYYSSRDLRLARDIWLEQLHCAQAASDFYTLALVLNNLGNCYVELGDSDAGSTYLIQAIQAFKELNQKPAALKTQWALGRLLISNGNLNEGLSRLRIVHEEFEQLELVAEAGLVALDLVEGLLASSKADEAAVICRYLAERFTACGMSSNAITALSYLREAMAAGKATPVLAKHVRIYLAELPRDGQLLFLPPPA